MLINNFMENEKLRQALRCLDCQGELEAVGDTIQCRKCSRQYSKIGNSIIFNKPKEFSSEEKNNTDSLVFKIKNQFKKSPKLFTLLHHLIYPVVGKSSKKFVKSLPPGALIINLGSGVMSISPRVIDVDYVPYANVSIVADAHQLPFKNESVDAVIAEHLLEHLSDPDKAVAEVKRILKPNGLIYILTPFMLGFHSSPNDYYRWTDQGLLHLFKNFENVKVSSFYGPTSALTFLFGEWLAILFSFNIKSLYNFWILVSMLMQILLKPLQIIDYILTRYDYSKNISYGFAVIASKK